MNKPAIAIIQARMSSSRLQGKVMKPLSGKPVIWHIYKRAEQCQMVDRVIVATSTDDSDDPLAEFCETNKMEYFRGSLDNVLSRFINILKENDYPYFARITGDCPLIHPAFIDQQIHALMKFDADVVWSKNESSVLQGQGVRSSRLLFHIAGRSSDRDDQEHVGSVYLAYHPEEFRIVEIEIPDGYMMQDIRLTIDEEKDYLLFTEIFNALYRDNVPIELSDVISWLRNNEKILSINREVKHKSLNVKLQEVRKKWMNCNKTGKIKLNI